VPTHLADEEPDVVLVQPADVVEVAAGPGAGPVARVEPHPADLRERPRQQRGLHPPGHFAFAVELGEGALQLVADEACFGGPGRHPGRGRPGAGQRAELGRERVRLDRVRDRRVGPGVQPGGEPLGRRHPQNRYHEVAEFGAPPADLRRGRLGPRPGRHHRDRHRAELDRGRGPEGVVGDREPGGRHQLPQVGPDRAPDGRAPQNRRGGEHCYQ
jgi:hypothetical protein